MAVAQALAVVDHQLGVDHSQTRGDSSGLVRSLKPDFFQWSQRVRMFDRVRGERAAVRSELCD